MPDEEKNIRDYLGNESYSKNKNEGEKSNEHLLYGLFMKSFIELENKFFILYEISNSRNVAALSDYGFPSENQLFLGC